MSAARLQKSEDEEAVDCCRGGRLLLANALNASLRWWFGFWVCIVRKTSNYLYVCTKLFKIDRGSENISAKASCWLLAALGRQFRVRSLVILCHRCSF